MTAIPYAAPATIVDDHDAVSRAEAGPELVVPAQFGGRRPTSEAAAASTAEFDRRHQRAALRGALQQDRVLRMAGVAVVLWLCGYAIAVSLTSGSTVGARVVAQYVYLLPIVLATALSVAVARRRGGAVGRFWKLMALSNLGWVAGDVIWAVYPLVTGHEAPFPSIADAVYLSSYAVIPVAVFFAFRGRHVLTHSRGVLDALAPTVVFAAAGWDFLLKPQASGGWSLGVLTGIAYPLLGVVIACLVVSLGFNARTSVPLSISTVMVALAVSAVTDTLYTHGAILHGYVGADWLNLGWQAEAVIICWAALAAWRHREPDSQEAPLGRDRGLICIALAIAVGLASMAAQVATDSVSWELTGAMLLALGLAVLRMYLSASEMRRIALALDQARAEQERLAVTDALTGLYNRRFVEELLQIEIERARRKQGNVGLIVIDVDHFKHVNDKYGHAVGDHVLVAVAERLSAALRPSDILARYGGEEFLAVVPDADSETTLEVAERLRVALASRPVTRHGYTIPVTVSAGVAGTLGDGDVTAMMREADRALYAAKAAGRNRVQLASDDSSVLSGGEEVPAGLARIADVVDARICADLHSKPMATWAGVLADRLGLDPETRRVVTVAARLHDIGKITVPDVLLNKPGPLDAGEWLVMREHSTEGARMLADLPGMSDIAEAVRAHHERYDGDGYPDQLAGEQIPMAARIIAVCDAWATMRANRPYSAARSEAEARAELSRCRGAHFDSQVVDAFLELQAARIVGDLHVNADDRPSPVQTVL